MHILLLSAYFPPETGSASHLFYELGRTFVARGHHVSVVTGFPAYHVQGDTQRYRGHKWMREDLDGLEVYRIAVLQVARHTPVGRALWQFSAAASFFIAGLRVPSPDVALVYSPPLPLGLTAFALRKVRGTPFVVNVQDLFPQSVIDLGILRNKALIRFFEGMERFVYKHADAITVHSAKNREHVVSKGGKAERTFVVHNSVDVDFLQPGDKHNVLCQRLGLCDKFVVSFAGVIGYSQDLDVVLEAARILQTYPDIHFLLVGDGVEKERLVRKSREMGLPNVTWLPMQPRDRYPDVLHMSDIGLATLHAEVRTPVVPSKIWSNMAAGVPVVAAMNLNGDAPALIEESGGGICVPPEDPHALADAILQLYRDPELRRSLGIQGRTYVERHLSPQVIAERYEAIFARLSHSETRRP